MEKLKIAAALALVLLMTACGTTSRKPTTDDVPLFDLLANVDKPEMNNIAFEDVKIMPLDTTVRALLGRRPEISGLMGDTLVIKDGERIVLFSLSTGKFIREISHKGYGPGEYTYLSGIFPDRANNDVVFTTLNDRWARYTAGDSLVASGTLPNFGRSTKMENGSVENCIVQQGVLGDTLSFITYTAGFEPVDTLMFPHYSPRYLSFLLLGSERGAIFNHNDTLFLINPHEVEPVAVLSRGEKAMTPEIEADLDSKKLDHKGVDAVRARYIEYINFVQGQDMSVITSQYNDYFFYDIYENATGELLYRSKLNRLEGGRAGYFMPVDGKECLIARIFIRDGKWYGIISEEELAGDDVEAADNLNSAIVSFVPVRK